MIDWNAIMGLAAVVTAVIAIVAVYLEIKNSRFVLGADLIVRLEERFTGSEMRRKRRKAAVFLLANPGLDKVCAELDEILDFFDTIGILSEKRALDMRLVRQMFFYWINPYYQGSKVYLQSVDKEDPAAFASLHKLYKELCKIEKKLRGEYYLKRSEDKEFFLSEADL